MRLMTWCLGLLVIFADHSAAVSCGTAVPWEWYTMLFVWFFVGLCALTVALVRIVSSKVKAAAGGKELAHAPVEWAKGKDD